MSHLFAEVLAQGAQVPELTWASAVIIYGPMGGMLVWFALRGERKLAEVVAELRVLGHRINGMTRAMLADVASRETTGHALRTLVERDLAKNEEDEEVKAIRAKREG